MLESAPAAPQAGKPYPILSAATVAQLSEARADSAAAASWRRAGQAALAQVPFPDRVRHLWRYTDATRFLPRRVGATVLTGEPATGAGEDPLAGIEGAAIALLAGRAPVVSAEAAASGLVIAPLLQDARDRDWVGQAVAGDHGYFEALNAAAWSGGLVIRAPRGLVLEQPLRVRVPALVDTDLLPRLLIVAEPGAQLTVVEEHHGGGAGGLVIGVTEVFVEDNAAVRHVLVQQWGEGQVGHLTQRARVQRDGRFLGAVASLGGSVAKLDLGAVLSGPGARSEMYGFTLPCGRQHLDHHTLHRHTSGRTWSNIDFKAAVFDRARSAYTGLIRIEKGAPASEAYQENRNLLLSDHARADTIPELEILTDEVSCSHGATAAPVDREQLFYLGSRGFSRDLARRFIVRGFVEPTLRQVPEALRAQLEHLLDERLDRLRGEA